MPDTIVFSTVQQATAQTKRLCRRENITVRAVNSRYLPQGAGIQTIIALPDGTSDAQYSKLAAVLYDAGYSNISVNSVVRSVSAVSANAACAKTSTMTAEQARTALLENLPELYDAADVAAMSDDEAIDEAVNAAVLEG